MKNLFFTITLLLIQLNGFSQTDTLYFQNFDNLNTSDRWFFNLTHPAPGYDIENGKGIMRIPTSSDINITIPSDSFQVNQSIAVSMVMIPDDTITLNVFISKNKYPFTSENTIISKIIYPGQNTVVLDLNFNGTLTKEDFLHLKFIADNNIIWPNFNVEIDDFLISTNNILTGLTLNSQKTEVDSIIYYLDINGKKIYNPKVDQIVIAVYKSGKRIKCIKF